MKKVILILSVFMSVISNAQEVKQVPQISVTGEGKIKLIPDEAIIRVSVENTGKVAADVKKKNDEAVDKVLKVIKSYGILSKDFQTDFVNLYNTYDYDLKKYNYVANQSISIHLKDLKKYDTLMMDMVNSGINQIQSVSFTSSKIKEHEKQMRINAMLDAKQKATDYVEALGNQKIGKALSISDNSTNYYPETVGIFNKNMALSGEALPANETLAIGEIEVVSRVSVVFMLE